MNSEKIIHMETPFAIKPYTKGQLVKLYRPISLYVLNKYLEAIAPQIGPIIANTLSVKQMLVFIDVYGIPGQSIREAA